jgi:hypothetical protein
MSTNYEAPHYAVTQTPVTSCLFDPNILLTSCSRTPSVYAPPLISETTFQIHTEPQTKL